MKKIWILFSLIPVPFLFHLYEYSQNLKGEKPTFLLVSFILLMLIVGFLSRNVKFIFVILMNLITIAISFLLSALFIPNDLTWFKPLDRNFAILFIGIIYLIGQLISRSISKNNKKIKR
ncbi:hypothetical protein [Bacillus testis]|uniref:hypothetical protein n=1 Tax=Bacillus testis TaxID=1622072 RepID=UPI00067F1207|nr:hypothetical protein [Bacillus testis]